MYNKNNYIHGYNIHSYAHVLDRKWIFLLIKHRYNSDKICWHFFEPKKLSPPPGPPPLQSSITMEILQSNGNIGKSSNVCSKGTKGCRLKNKQVRQHWTIVSFLFKFSPFNVSKRLNIYPSKWAMEGRVRAFSRNMEGQESSYSNPYEENSKNICLYGHIPMYSGLRSKVSYTHEYGFKSHV